MDVEKIRAKSQIANELAQLTERDEGAKKTPKKF